MKKTVFLKIYSENSIILIKKSFNRDLFLI